MGGHSRSPLTSRGSPGCLKGVVASAGELRDLLNCAAGPILAKEISGATVNSEKAEQPMKW